MGNGTLRELLTKRGAESFPWPQRRGFCVDIAAGMQFLHSRSPPMIHRDLKSDNCLVSDGMSVKIADFGTVTRPHSGNLAAGPSHAGSTGSLTSELMIMTATLGAGTPLWMAPEVHDGKFGIAHYGPAVDVYSFGMVMYEVSSGKLPYHNKEFKHNMALADHVLAGNRPDDVPGSTPTGFRFIMEQCWSADPQERPTFESMVELLEAKHEYLMASSRRRRTIAPGAQAAHVSQHESWPPAAAAGPSSNA
jgi:serine/threonine protein kinase